MAADPQGTGDVDALPVRFDGESLVVGEAVLAAAD
jgi:hypothetical protein